MSIHLCDYALGGPHLGPYYSEGQGQGQGQGGVGGQEGGYPPFSDGSSSGSGSHPNINMNQSTDNIAFQPFNRFLIFHSNANVTYSPQNSNCNTFAYGTLPPRPYDLQTSNAYRNNNWNNSWNNNWNNIGNDDCYTYKCIYSLDDFADHKHSLMDSKEPCRDSSSSSSKINSDSNSEDDSNGSKSANDGSNNNSNTNNSNINSNGNMRSSQPAGLNNGQSHVVASTTTCSGDSDSSIAYLADSYSTSNPRSSLHRVGVLQGAPQDDIRLAAHVNGCADTPTHLNKVSEYHEYRDQTADRDRSGCEARYGEDHDCEQEQEKDQEEEQQQEDAYDNENTVSLAASLSYPAGSLPLIPHGLFTGAHDSVPKCSIPVHDSVVNTSVQTLCRSPTAVTENDGGDNRNSTRALEGVTGDVAGDGDKREEWQEQAHEGSTPHANGLLTASQSEKMLRTRSMLVTEKGRAASWADDEELKRDETASSGHPHILKSSELGWKVNLLPRQMLVRRSSAPKLSSSTPPSSSQRQGNMKGREINGPQHGRDIKKKQQQQQQQQQQQAPHTVESTASHLASTVPGTCVRKPFSCPEHVKVHRPDVLNLHDKGKSAEINSSSAIVTGHDRTEQNAVSPAVSLHFKPDEAALTMQEVCVACTNDMPLSGQEDNGYLLANESIHRDDGKVINISADRKQGNQERGERAATINGSGCSTTLADTSDPLLALALPRSPPNTVLYTHSSPQTMRVSTSSNKSHSPVVSSPGPLPHTPHSQPMSPSAPLPLSDGIKILTSSPRYAKGESPHSPSCGSRSLIQSPNVDGQGDGRYMKDLLLMSLRCLRSEKERALLLNQQAVQSAVIAGLQHRMFPLPIPLPLPLPTQNLSSRAHLPFAKSLNNEFPPKHSGFTAQNISDEPPHVFNLKRHHTFDSRTER